jgi:DNA-binding winged helix-turn-helix (wHTH) protein/TolB-like protein/Tfp pilus assembly protein PilF
MYDLQSQNYEFGEFRIDAAKRLLKKEDNEIVPLTPKVFDLLLYLVQNNGKVIEKDELMTAIWTDSIVEENNLSQNISILRRILGEKRGEHIFIATVPGRGYKFVAEVSESRSQSKDQAVEASENHTSRVTNPDSSPETQEPKTKDRKIFVFGALILLVAGVAFVYWWSESKKAGIAAPTKTIAVLPFKPIAAGIRDEALEMGMADALISKLSGNGEVTVRPLSSVRRYASLEQDSLAAGRELGTETVLDGSIQTSGERIRISAKLFRTSDGRQLWAGQFDERFTDIFAVQDSISEKVATALKITLGGKEKKRATENIEAYQFYMKGRFHSSKIILPETEKGIAYYNQAIGLDPNYALAYAGIADAYRSLALTSDVPSWETMPKAKAAALQAIKIDEALAEGHAALGFIAFFYDWDWAAAEKNYLRGLELDHHSADLRQSRAHLLSNIGQHERALEEIKLSRELEPLNLRTNALEVQFLLHAGQIDEALDRLHKTIDLDPNFWLVHLFAASAYIEKGMYAEAVQEGREANRISPSQNWSIAFSGYALAKAGKLEEAQDVLDELLELSKTRYVPAYHLALLYNDGHPFLIHEFQHSVFVVGDHQFFRGYSCSC